MVGGSSSCLEVWPRPLWVHGRPKSHLSISTAACPCSEQCRVEGRYWVYGGLNSSIAIEQKKVGIRRSAGGGLVRRICAFSESSTHRISGSDGFPARSDQSSERSAEWEKEQRENTKRLARLRKQEEEQEAFKDEEYRRISQQLQGFPQEEVRVAKILVASLIKAGHQVEEMIIEAGDNGELSPLTLLVIKNRLEIARQDDERDAIQALDLLYRRMETELLRRDAPLALQLVDQLLNLHDGFSHQEWLQRCRHTMLEVFVPEDAFTILAPLSMDLENQTGPIEMPDEDDAVLRIDFIREVDSLLSEIEAESVIKPIEGLDPESVAVRLKQQEKLRTIEQVRELRKLAAALKW